MMTNNGAAKQWPPLQLLLIACPTTYQEGARYAWLHGFCLLTLRPGPESVQLDGEMRIGRRRAENADLVRDLAEALDSEAVLAGYDLQDTISRIGRLPIDASEPEPALALLNKLRAMLDGHSPIDVGRDEDSRMIVHNQAVANNLKVGEDLDDSDEDIQVIGGAEIRTGLDNGNPRRLAVELADTAGASLLAIGEAYLPDELQPKLLEAWNVWKGQHRPVFPQSGYAEVAQDR